ncbi:MAG: lysostaphin resistance A-like protein, partial [Pyrinomonadaceae bacterium]
VEEVVYRGLLFPTLQRSLNTTAAIAAVSVLFALVHVPQYWNNVGVIIAITLLSVTLTLVRARTGRLLPCFVIHLVFNGIQSVLILLGASERFAPQPEPPVQEGAVQLLTHLSGLFC